MNNHKVIISTTIGAILVFGILILNQNFNPKSDQLNEPSVSTELETPVAEATTPDTRIAKVFADNINSGDEISLPIEITGHAVGTWFFEASFPAIIEDKDGNPIGSGIMQAQGEWMTENHVPFKGTIEKAYDYKGPALLKLRKDNPSGDPALNEEVVIEVIIK